MCPSLLGLGQSTFFKTSQLDSTVGLVFKIANELEKIRNRKRNEYFCGLSFLFLLSRESEKALREICGVYVI